MGKYAANHKDKHEEGKGMSKLIEGPWWVDDDGYIVMGSGDDYRTVADLICSGIGLENKRAVRDLIAAAPELRDMLIKVMSTDAVRFAEQSARPGCVYEKARELIAKLGGQ